jgi:ChpA-C
MKKVRWVSATAGAALVAAMFALPGAGAAYASDNGNTTGNGNVLVLSGNSITAPVSVPVNLCGSKCHCHGNGCNPPGCTANCGGTPPGTSPGTTTTVSTGTSPSSLPTTGADLLLLGVAALGSIGVGAGAVAVARRRRNSEV